MLTRIFNKHSKNVTEGNNIYFGQSINQNKQTLSISPYSFCLLQFSLTCCNFLIGM